MKEKDTFLTAREVATMTGLSIETLARWRSQRWGIPYVKIGRVVRYRQGDVEAYLESCRIPVSDARTIRATGPRKTEGEGS